MIGAIGRIGLMVCPKAATGATALLTGAIVLATAVAGAVAPATFNPPAVIAGMFLAAPAPIVNNVDKSPAAPTGSSARVRLIASQLPKRSLT